MKIDKKYKKYKRTGERIEKAIKSTFVQFSKVELIDKSEGIEEQIKICLFVSKYNYKLIVLEYDEKATIFEYMEAINSALVNKKFTVHTASLGEILLSNLIKEYHSEKIFIVEGTLCSANGQDIVSLSYLKSIEFSKVGGIITLIDKDGEYVGKSIVDFASETITFMEGIQDGIMVYKNNNQLPLI